MKEKIEAKEQTKERPTEGPFLAESEPEKPEEMLPEEKSWLKTFREKISGIFKKEKKELPHLTFDIFYAPHAYAKDIEGLEERLKLADIYIPEVLGWEKRDKIIFRQLSDGKITLLEAYEKGKYATDDFWRCGLALIYKSGKAITFADLPQRHPLRKDFNKYWRNHIETFKKLDFRNDFGGALEWFKKEGSRCADLNKKRENYMLSNLKKAVADLLQSRPELQDKKELRILMQLGGAHTNIYHTLKKQGEAAERKFNVMPFVFSFEEELLRRYIFGKEVDDTLAARALMEFIIILNRYSQISGSVGLIRDIEKKNKFLRKVISGFSLEEIKHYFTGDMTMDEILAAKEIKVPHTEQELDEFLAANHKS